MYKLCTGNIRSEITNMTEKFVRDTKKKWKNKNDDEIFEIE